MCLEQEINCALGYSFKVLRQRTRQVRKGGETEKNLEWIEDLTREAHTIKGSSKVFGFTEIQDIAHRIEDIFEKIKNFCGEGDIILLEGRVSHSMSLTNKLISFLVC